MQPGLFGERQASLATIIERMDQAAKDKDVIAVWLRIEDLALGGGKVNELRAAVGRLRKAGKPVYAELTGGDTSEYLLAAACNEVYMPPSGMLIVPGIRAEVTFYKGLLDKLGLQFDALKMGKYKGAVEPLTRTSMSGPLRESMEAIVDDSYEALVNRIAGDRRLKDYKVKTLLDQGLFTAATAEKAGLIDRVCYSDQFQDSLKTKLKVDEVEVVTNYKKKQVDTDFSGIGGLVKLIELLTGGKPAEKVAAQKRIAVVYAVGTIVEGKGNDDMFGSSALGSTTMIEALRKAADDPKVVAIVLRVDSPGGSATASDLIWREVVRSKKPVIASMGNVAASGGYYISMPARKIVAEPGTITGSIGVFGGKLVTKGLYEKLGLTTEVISRGANSGALSSSQPFTPEERKAWTELLTETYQQFVQKAAEGRKMSPQRLAELAQGRVYTGRMAKKIGLVDELGTLNDAVVAAKQAAGLKADAAVELLILPQPKSVFEQLFGDPSAASDLDSVAPEWFHLVRQAKLWQRLLGEKVLLWMPYEVQVR
jgi:protease-4